MGHSVPLPNSPAGPVAASWLISCLLHAGLAFAAVLFVQRIQLAAQTEPFQWDVAVVAPFSTSVNSAPAAQPTTPPAQAVDQPTPAVKTAYPARRPIEPATAGPAASAPTTSSAERSQDQLLRHEPNPSSPAPALLTDPPSDLAPQHRSATVSEQTTPPHDESTAAVDSETATDSPLAPSPSTVAPFSSTDQLRSAKADYGWLTAIMAQWIEDLNKRYPAILRTEGVEGKVTLVAMLHENGRLSGVRVVKSSGHAALDQVAVEDVTNGPPITLTHPLNRAQMPVKFSISYDLKMAR
jgi:protein TonB